jgi:pilus assembly protein CpaC
VLNLAPPHPSQQPAARIPAPPQPGDVDDLPAAIDAETPSEGPLIELAAEPRQEITIEVNKSRVFQVRRPVRTALVTNPEIADVRIIDQDEANPRIFSLFGNRFGTTTLTVWDEAGASESFLLRVTVDTTALEGRIAETVLGSDITIRQVGDQLVLEGQAASSKVMADVLQLVAAELRLQNSTAQMLGMPNAMNAGPNGANMTGGAGGSMMASYVTESVMVPGIGSGLIVNRVHVPGPRQIMLRVKFAELNRTAMRQMGVNWLDNRHNDVIGSTIEGLADFSTDQVASGGSVSQTARFGFRNNLPLSSAFSGTGLAQFNGNSQLFGLFNAGQFNLFINALRSNNIAKILAEPNLVTLDGQPARFQSGGQYPIPVPQAGAGGVGSVITIVWKDYGAILSFLPQILDGDVIRLDIEPNFSELNSQEQFAIPGTQGSVPGINTRNARTVVEMREGQTLALAGLLTTRTVGTTSRVPGLGDLPVVGNLFSHNTIQTIESELVVLVTPELVEPVEKGEVPPAPGDLVEEPNDLEFFLLGRIEGKTGLNPRATIDYQDPLCIMRHQKSEARWVVGPHGYAD